MRSFPLLPHYFPFYHASVNYTLTLDSMYRTLKCDHWKTVEQYFTVVLFVNPTPWVKSWRVIQSFLTFDSMDRTLNCDHSLESCWTVLYCGNVCHFRKFINFGLSGVKELRLSRPMCWQPWSCSAFCSSGRISSRYLYITLTMTPVMSFNIKTHKGRHT